MELLQARFDERKFVCVGLDSDMDKIHDLHPDLPGTTILGSEYVNTPQGAFNRAIVDVTKDLVCAYKPNIAFYEAAGPEGWAALASTIEYIHQEAPGVPVILDAKRADIGNTNMGYVTAAFDELGADAITVHPYLGQEALKPFLDRGDKGIIVLCRTSNPGAGEFQDVVVSLSRQGGKDLGLPPQPSALGPHAMPLYELVAHRVAKEWNGNGNCAVVVGATYPEELADVREIVGDMPILIPGIGAQGGDLEATIRNGRNSQGQGMIVNNSRGIIFSEDARVATQTMHDAITAALVAA